MEPEQKMIDGERVPDFMRQKNVLLVAQTELSLKYKEAIEDYCKTNKPILISINQPKEGLKLDYDLVIISHNEKFREDEQSYLLEPYNYVALKAMFKNTKINISHNYGILVDKDKFNNHGSYASVPNRLTLAYAIAFCIDAGVDKLNLVGFGGFDLDEKRHKEIQSFLQILASEKKIELFSLTPTTFSISRNQFMLLNSLI